MKRNLLKLSLLLISLTVVGKAARAQYIIKAADAQYELYNYDKAIDLYEQAYKKKATLHSAERLASSNAFMHNYKETESWYAIAVSLPGSPAEDWLNYAKALQSNSKYSEARAAYGKYAGLNNTVTASQASLWSRSCDSALMWMKNPGPYTMKNEQRLNSAQSDWGATVYNGHVVYTSDRSNKQASVSGTKRPFLKFDGAKRPDKQVYGWTGNKYLRLYSYDKGADSTTLFPLPAGTDYHVGSASFSGDGNEMFFTLTRIPHDPKYVKGKLATINVELYSSKKDASGNWSTPAAFKYNNVNEWSVGDPYLTADGKRLYFASTMPGGKGGADLYVSFRSGQGDWEQPVNLEAVNTEGNEHSPYFDADNNFYFSSDGYAGMGGLDIFKAVNKGGKLGTPRNLGYPVNSPQDDFSYSSTTATMGYLSSDRMNGLGSDDIYSFTETITKKILALAGTVYNKTTQARVAHAIVSLGKADGGTLKVETDSTGTFNFALDAGSDYTLTGEKTGYRSDAAQVTTVGVTSSAPLRRDLYLEAVEIDKAIRLENIYYDFDKWNIRADAALELDKLVKIMEDNPTMWIELGSHTDSRGNDAYNLSLSQKRAESAVQYIISRGISRNRIAAKGYGETRLLNKCTNGVACSIAEHQLNRRTEFKIVKQ